MSCGGAGSGRHSSKQRDCEWAETGLHPLHLSHARPARGAGAAGPWDSIQAAYWLGHRQQSGDILLAPSPGRPQCTSRKSAWQNAAVHSLWAAFQRKLQSPLLEGRVTGGEASSIWDVESVHEWSAEETHPEAESADINKWNHWCREPVANSLFNNYR